MTEPQGQAGDDQGGGDEGGEGQELHAPPEASFITDPVLSESVELHYDVPACGSPTEGPNRFTIHVPTDEAVFSLGQASKRHINDTGITARTKTHIHLFANEEDPTMISLGGPAHEGFAGYKGNKLLGSTGFMMVTQGAAWLDAKEQLYLVSRDDDVVVRAANAKKVLVQADAGAVHIGGGKAVVIGGKDAVSIYADAGFAKADPDYKGEVGEEIEKAFHAGWAQIASTAFDWAQVVYGVVMGVVGVAHERKEALKENKGWKVGAAKEAASAAAEVGKGIAAAARAFASEEAPGSVGIHAQNEIGIVAGGALELFGKVSAGIVSLVGVDLVGGTASVKALTFGGIWAGAIASLKGGMDVSIGAEHGECAIKGKKAVNISSDKEVKIQAEHEALLVGKEGSAVVFGEHWVYAAANGYGMKATSHGVELGKMASPTEYGAAKGESTSIVKITDSSVSLYAKGAGILLDGDSCKFFSKGDAAVFKLQDNGQAVANGSKILLG